MHTQSSTSIVKFLRFLYKGYIKFSLAEMGVKFLPLGGDGVRFR